jgi:hypothetical protein
MLAAFDKWTVPRTQFLHANPVDARHLVQQLQQDPVERCVLILKCPNQFQQSRERLLVVHLLKCGFVLLAIVQQKCRNQVQLRPLVFLHADEPLLLHSLAFTYLKEPVDNLPPHILLVTSEQLRIQQLVGAPRNVVLGSQVFI